MVSKEVVKNSTYLINIILVVIVQNIDGIVKKIHIVENLEIFFIKDIVLLSISIVNVNFVRDIL